MKKLCSNCFQEIKDGEKNCSLCKTPYVQTVDVDPYEPVKVREKPTKLQLHKGVLAIIISAVLAVCAGAIGTVFYLTNSETPENVALDGLYVLLNADIRSYASRHAFIESEIGLAIRTERAASWDDAVLPLVWERYNKFEKILDLLRKNDIEVIVSGSEELTDEEKDIALDNIYATIIGDSDDLIKAEMIESINNNVDRLYLVNIDVFEADDKTSSNTQIDIYIGMINGKWSILNETLH